MPEQTAAPVFRLNDRVTLEEDYECEFKAVTGHNPFNRIRKDAEEYIVAFLNSNTGAIYFGIENDGTVTGLLMDKHARDEARTFIDQKIMAISPPVLPEWITTEFFPVYEGDLPREDLCVLKISVQKGTEVLYYTSSDEAWVKLSGSKYKLNAMQINQRIEDHVRARISSEIEVAETVKIPIPASSESETPDAESVRKGWQGYLSRLRDRFGPTRLGESYLPWAYEQDGRVMDLEARIRDFLTSESERTIMIVGRPGAGKTTFLQHLVRVLAEEAIANLESQEDMRRPTEMVPLYVDLNSYKSDRATPFAAHVFQRSEILQYIVSDPVFVIDQPELVLADPPVPLLVCLDALDEVDVEARHQTLRVIRRFIRQFPSLRIIVVSRSDTVRGEWRQLETVKMASLDEEQVREYLSRHLREMADEAFSFLTSNPDLSELMYIPLLLSATVEYLRRTEEERQEYRRQFDIQDGESPERTVPALSEAALIDHLITVVFEWEEDKNIARGFDPRTPEWADMLGELAYWTDGHKRHFLRREALQFVNSADLSRFFNMGIICIRGTWLSFINDLVHLYFAAHILPLKIEEELNWICEQVGQNVWWQMCIRFAQELPYVDVTPILERVSVLSSD